MSNIDIKERIERAYFLIDIKRPNRPSKGSPRSLRRSGRGASSAFVQAHGPRSEGGRRMGAPDEPSLAQSRDGAVLLQRTWVVVALDHATTPRRAVQRVGTNHATRGQRSCA